MAKTTHLVDFDSDSYQQQVIAFRLMNGEEEDEIPMHQHRKCQLVMPLTGFVRSTIDNSVWIVPAHCAVWIPSQIIHKNTISPDANLCMLYIDPDVSNMPDKGCTLSISPLLRELIITLSSRDKYYSESDSTGRLVSVLIDELCSMPTERFDFPIPTEPRLNKVANLLLKNPADRKTVSQWASQFAMSERTFSRLVKQEIGMTFGRWRGQLHIIMALQKLSSKESVQRIAEDLGYESASAFITFFKKTLGKSPKKYMK